MFGFLRKNEIVVEQTRKGSHGDHWGAAVGFDTFSSNSQYVIDIINSTFQGSKPQLYNNYSVYLKNEGRIGFVVISDNKNKIVTSYPYLRSTSILPLKIIKIIEWKHINGLEAQIEGKGRDTFGIKYFAIDYYKNELHYKKNSSYDVTLAGFAYNISIAEKLPENFSSSFVCYLPSSNISDIDVFDFIGEIKEIEEITFDKITGFVFNVKLINDDSDGNFFDLDVFVNRENLRIESPEIGMKIAGSFWLQGYKDL